MTNIIIQYDIEYLTDTFCNYPKYNHIYGTPKEQLYKALINAYKWCFVTKHPAKNNPQAKIRCWRYGTINKYYSTPRVIKYIDIKNNISQKAACLIQAQFRESISNPSYQMCHRRLMREFYEFDKF